MSGPLNGKIAWVTGGGSGIGEAAALTLARYGAGVILTGRRTQPLERVAMLVRETGSDAEVLPGDLSRPKTAAALVREIDKRHGRLDILVNNAGTNIPDRNWAHLSEEGALQVMEGNLVSAFLVVVAVLPIMRRLHDGVIINTASIAGRMVSAQPGPAYTAAKHGVVAMSHSINLEENRNGIRSTAICPGEVATPLVEKRAVPVPEEIRARMLQPTDVGDLVAYVALLPKRVCVSEILLAPTRA